MLVQCGFGMVGGAVRSGLVYGVARNVISHVCWYGMMVWFDRTCMEKFMYVILYVGGKE